MGITAKTVHKLARDGRLGCAEVTARERRFTMELVEEFIKGETRHRDRALDKPHGTTTPHEIDYNPYQQQQAQVPPYGSAESNWQYPPVR